MGAITKIEWTDKTFNPWIACTRVSTGCANCYAEALLDGVAHNEFPIANDTCPL